MRLNDKMRKQCIDYCKSLNLKDGERRDLTTELHLQKWYAEGNHGIYRRGTDGQAVRVAEISDVSSDAFIHVAYCIFVATYCIPMERACDSPISL